MNDVIGMTTCKKHNREHRLLNVAGHGCPDCAREGWQKSHQEMLRKIDLLDHPLFPFFLKVAAEYDRSVEKYGDWEGKSVFYRMDAIHKEYGEYRTAYRRWDIHGEHGMLAEGAQVANCLGKQHLQLTKEPR